MQPKGSLLRTWLCLLATLLASHAKAANPPIALLSDSATLPWEYRSFSGDTVYQTAAVGGFSCLQAKAHNSASGLFREIKIDLNKTPILNWQWYVEQTFTGIDENSKSGDDYPARVYVVISGGLFFWRTRALNYVWASAKPKGADWPNAYTGNAVMLAVQSGPEHTQQWLTERRNVLADIKTYLGIDASEVSAVAIMTDTDNSKQDASACYRELYFSESN